MTRESEKRVRDRRRACVEGQARDGERGKKDVGEETQFGVT